LQPPNLGYSAYRPRAVLGAAWVIFKPALIEQAYQLADLSAMVNVTAFLTSIGFTLAYARDMRYNKIQWSMYRGSQVTTRT
jgi:hypothetical protein